MPVLRLSPAVRALVWKVLRRRLQTGSRELERDRFGFVLHTIRVDPLNSPSRERQSIMDTHTVYRVHVRLSVRHLLTAICTSGRYFFPCNRFPLSRVIVIVKIFFVRWNNEICCKRGKYMLSFTIFKGTFICRLGCSVACALVAWLLDRSIDWSIAVLFGWSIDWAVDWLVHWQTGCSIFLLVWIMLSFVDSFVNWLMVDSMLVRLVDWLTDWLAGLLAASPTDLLIYQWNDIAGLMDWRIVWLTGWFIRWFVLRLLVDCWFRDRLLVQLINWVIDWLSKWLVDWSVDFWPYWMTDRLTDRPMDGRNEYWVAWLIPWFSDSINDSVDCWLISWLLID